MTSTIQWLELAGLANEAIVRGDDELFRASNMDKLYRRLMDITVNDVAQMKLKTLGDWINKMIDAVIGTKDTTSLLKMKEESLSLSPFPHLIQRS